MSEIKQTHIPFLPKICIANDGVGSELHEQIKKIAARYGKNPHDFSARIELLPIPGEDDGHFLSAEVTYEHGELKKAAQ